MVLHSGGSGDGGVPRHPLTPCEGPDLHLRFPHQGRSHQSFEGGLKGIEPPSLPLTVTLTLTRRVSQKGIIFFSGSALTCQVISEVGDLVGVKYFPVEPEKNLAGNGGATVE